MLASLGSQPYVLSTFQGPGAADTDVAGINNAGTVVGTTIGGGYVRDPAGKITTFLVPGLDSTIATGINNSGTVVAYNTFGYGPGAIRDAAGTITTFRIPGLPETRLEGIFGPSINDAGAIAGSYESGGRESGGRVGGFVRDPSGNIVTFAAPGAIDTFVSAINDAGMVLGSSDSSLYPYYLRDASGNFTAITVPGSDATFAGAINDAGTVAGTFTADGQRHGYLRDASGHFATFDLPGAANFSITAVNNSGMVAGISWGLPGVDQQGFLRDTAGNVMFFTPEPSGYVVSVQLNDAGVVAGAVRGVVGRRDDRIGFIVAPASNPVDPPVPPPVDPPVPPRVDPPVVPPVESPVTPPVELPVTPPVVVPTGSSDAAPVAPAAVVPPVVAPVVTTVQRLGYLAAPTRIIVHFSTGLDPARAEDVGNYRIVDRRGRPIAVDSATYSAGTNTVTLRPHGRLDLHFVYRLTVNGSAPGGVTGASGTPLDGAGNGVPGSDKITNLTASQLVLGRPVPGGPARRARLEAILAGIEASQARDLAQHQPTSKPTPRRTPAAKVASATRRSPPAYTASRP